MLSSLKWNMGNTPAGKKVSCPECKKELIALVPYRSKIVEKEGDADGKVMVNCKTCGKRFLVYYRLSR